MPPSDKRIDDDEVDAERGDTDLETAFSAWLDGKAQQSNTAQRVA
ncbi:hypothetical protein [Cryobacterium sp. Y62]|nr:hypothetical protein [Cryobacterium sp. Y62]